MVDSLKVEKKMKIIREPSIYIIGKQTINSEEIEKFMQDNEVSWKTDTEIGAEMLCEVSGRICYMSFGARQGRKTNKEYLINIIESQHGSVLEHAVWNFIICGVSRSFTHELVRHRAGWGYSQLSQRFVDESETDFIEPDLISEDSELHKIWIECLENILNDYKLILEKLTEKVDKKYQKLSQVMKKKLVRQTARSILPNATETKIFVTANARALRHFFELRGSMSADVEMRKVAVKMLRLMQKEAPNMFSDYKIVRADDGTEIVKTEHRKV